MRGIIMESTRTRIVSVIAAILSSALVASCALIPTDAPPLPAGGNAKPNCASAAISSCALPFPSNEFTSPDPNSATGLKVDVPTDVVPRHLTEQLGPGGTLEDSIAGANGFSAVTPVIFELDQRVDASSLPSNGGNVIQVLNERTGEPISIRAELPIDSLVRNGGHERVLMAWPQTSFEYGETYVAYLTNELESQSGRPFRRSLNLDDASTPAGNVAATVNKFTGIKSSSLLSATRFTIRTRDNATSTLMKMAAATRAMDHPVRHLVADVAPLIPAAAGIVRGEVLITDFRNDSGVIKSLDNPTGTWVPFMMVVPRRAPESGAAPVAIYGHGLSIMKESMIVVAETNAQRGVATIGIDVPNHGERQDGYGGYLLEVANPQGLGRLAAMTTQAPAEHVALMLAVQDHLDGMTFEFHDWLTGEPVSAPAIDGTRIFYQGTSMGGVLGLSFTAIAPEIEASYLQVPGTGIIDIIYHSLLWVGFMGVIPYHGEAGDSAAMIGVATLLFDRSDSVNLLPDLKANGTPTFVSYGVGDAIVPAFATERIINGLDLPLVGEQIGDLDIEFDVYDGDFPTNGFGFQQVYPESWDENWVGFGGHLAFMEGQGQHSLELWLDQLVASTPEGEPAAAAN